MSEPEPTEGPASLLSIPPELCVMICELVLVASKPIVVWKGMYWTNKRVDWWNNDREAVRSSLGGLAIELLLVNKKVGGLAAEIFYNRNVFSFLGDHNWVEVTQWLESIGKVNSGRLRNLAIDVDCQPRCFRKHDGMKYQLNDLYSLPIYPPNPRLSFVGPVLPGIVENINWPDLESMFNTLSSCGGNAKKLKIEMRCDFWYLPGFDNSPEFESWPEQRKPNEVDITMDLPNMVEIMRADYALREPKRQIDIVWHCIGPPRAVGLRSDTENADNHECPLQKVGWEILSEIPCKYDEKDEWSTMALGSVGCTEYIFKRKPILPGSTVHASPRLKNSPRRVKVRIPHPSGMGYVVKEVGWKTRDYNPAEFDVTDNLGHEAHT